MWIRLRTTLGTVPEMGGGCHHLSLGSTMCYRNHFHFGSAFWYAVSLPLFLSSPLWETNLRLTNPCSCCQRKEVGGSFTHPREARLPPHHPGGHALWLLLVDSEGKWIPYSEGERAKLWATERPPAEVSSEGLMGTFGLTSFFVDRHKRDEWQHLVLYWDKKSTVLSL